MMTNDILTVEDGYNTVTATIRVSPESQAKWWMDSILLLVHLIGLSHHHHGGALSLFVFFDNDVDVLTLFAYLLTFSYMAAEAASDGSKQ